MATRLPASQRTREELTALIEGRLSTASAKDELIKLASRLIVEEALEGEAGDALRREYYAHGAEPGQGGLSRLACPSPWAASRKVGFEPRGAEGGLCGLRSSHDARGVAQGIRES